eukprot:m.1527755 g.1527755  ORF g.1527755 m.1527755 type:complete len:1595 (-) comp25235_c0_seq5:831-5615(-)
MMASGPQLPLDYLIHHVTQDAYDQLTKLVELLPNKDSTSRKQLLLKYLHETRCRFLRLLVVVKSLGVAEHVSKCSEILQHFENKDNIFANVGHRLRSHHVNLVLHGARVPAYAIPNAVDMLTTGTYTRIPTKIRALAPPETPSDGEVRQAMRWLDQHIGARLIDTHLPHVISTSTVRRGRLWLGETGLYEVSLTLSGPQPEDPWRLLSLDVLVGQTDGDAGLGSADGGGGTVGGRALARDQIPPLHQRAQHVLSTVVPTHAVHAMCTTLRGLCLAVRLTMLIEEATRLERHSHRSLLRVRHTGSQCVTLEYWLVSGGGKQREGGAAQRQHGTAVNGSRALLKVELSKELEKNKESPNYGGVAAVSLVATHCPPLVDPTTDAVAVFDPTRFGVAQLLQRAVDLSVHQRLAALVDALRSAEVFPTGLEGITLAFLHTAERAEAALTGQQHPQTTASLQLVYKHSGSVGASDMHFPTVELNVHVDPTSGNFVLSSSSPIVRASQACMTAMHACAERLNTDVATASAVLRCLRLHLALCVLEASASVWPVCAVRHLPATPSQRVPQPNVTAVDDITTTSVYLQFHRYPRFVLAVRVNPAEAFSESYQLLETDGGSGSRYATPTSMQTTGSDNTVLPGAAVGAVGSAKDGVARKTSDKLLPTVIARVDVAALRADADATAQATKRRRTMVGDVVRVSLAEAMELCLARIPALAVVKHLHKYKVPFTYSVSEQCATVLSLPPPRLPHASSAVAATHSAALCSLVDTCVIRTDTGDGQAEVTFCEAFPVDYVRVTEGSTQDIAAWDPQARRLTFAACDVDVCVDRFMQAWQQSCLLFSLLVDVELDADNAADGAVAEATTTATVPRGFRLSGCRCFFGFVAVTAQWEAEACDKNGGRHTARLVCNTVPESSGGSEPSSGGGPYTWEFPRGSPMQLLVPQFTWELNAGSGISDVLRLMRHSCAALTGVQMLFDQEPQSHRKTCMFVARNCTQARLIYKGVVGIDMFFAAVDYVLMQQTKTPTNVGKLEDFINGVLAKVDPNAVANSVHVHRDLCDRFVVPSEIFVAMCTSACAFPSAPPNASATATATSALVPLGRTASALPSPPRQRLDPPLKQFLNSMHMRTLLEAVPKTINASGIDIQLKTLTSASSSARPQGAPLIFTVNGGQRRITVTSHSLTHTSLSLFIDSAEKDFLDMTEKNTLKSFFHARVAAENVFVSGVVESFMNIVAAPLGVLRQFVKLMASDLTIGDKTPHGGNVRLHLTVPPGLPADMQCMAPPKAAVVVEKTTKVPYTVKAYMVVRLRNAQQELIDLALCFNGKECGWGWGQHGGRRTPDLDRLRVLAMQLPQSSTAAGVPSLNAYPNDVFGDAILTLAREHHGVAKANGGEATNAVPKPPAHHHQQPPIAAASPAHAVPVAAIPAHGPSNGAPMATTNGGHAPASVGGLVGGLSVQPAAPMAALPSMGGGSNAATPLGNTLGCTLPTNSAGFAPTAAVLPSAVAMQSTVQSTLGAAAMPSESITAPHSVMVGIPGMNDTGSRQNMVTPPTAQSTVDPTTPSHIIATSNTAVAGAPVMNSSGPLQDAAAAKPGTSDAVLSSMDTSLS